MSVVSRLLTEQSYVEQGWRGPFPGGQGEHPSRGQDHPLVATIIRHGYQYSHTTPIHNRDGTTYLHHTFQHPANPEHKVSVDDSNPRRWDTTTTPASGRRTNGSGAASLDKHLANKARRYRLR